MVRILWDLLHQRSLIFYHGGEAYTRRVGVKGLPQGFVLSPLPYNVGGSGIDAQMVRRVSLLQYADDLVIYASEFIVQQIRASLQNSLDAVSVFLSDLDLHKYNDLITSEVLFSKRPVESPPSLTMGGIGLPISKEFKYLGVVFDRGSTWNAHTRYVLKRCKTRVNFMRSIAGTAWRSHPDKILIVYKSLVRSVLEYGCVCFSTT
jgi:hypothetical protein